VKYLLIKTPGLPAILSGKATPGIDPGVEIDIDFAQA
jgi:hypothetical protein